MQRDEAVGKLAEVIQRKHLAHSTGRSYGAWLKRYCDFIQRLPSHVSSEQKLERFLTALAQEDVAASTQNQALNAAERKMPGKETAEAPRRRERGQPHGEIHLVFRRSRRGARGTARPAFAFGMMMRGGAARFGFCIWHDGRGSGGPGQCRGGVWISAGGFVEN